MMMHEDHTFATGMGLGLMAGAALAMTLTPKPARQVKKTAHKAAKALGQVMEDLGNDLGI